MSLRPLYLLFISPKSSLRIQTCLEKDQDKQNRFVSKNQIIAKITSKIYQTLRYLTKQELLKKSRKLNPLFNRLIALKL